MLKRDELTHPRSCMSRARDEEMTFVLLGRDAASPATIRFWAAERVRLGKNRPSDPQIVEALAAAELLERARDADFVPPFLVTEFERGHAPCDEPPGLEERAYRLWKAAGGWVRPPEPVTADDL